MKKEFYMMKRRIFATALACAMALSLLTSCGPKGGTSSGSSTAGSDVSTMAPGSASSQPDSSGDTSAPDSSIPDASQPDASQPDGSQPTVDEPQAQASLSLSKSDFTLGSAGATWQLKAKAEPAGGKLTWASSNEAVATVSENGTVTAVSKGTATITVTDEATGLTASCIVRCHIEESKPNQNGSSSGSNSNGSSSSNGNSSSGETSKPSANVDLTAFASNIMGSYEFGMLQLLDADLLEQLYPGMGAVSAEQKLIYGTMMTMNNGEFGLVQVKDSKDAATAKAIFQARIDGMVNGGAFYPEATQIWTENSRVVTNGNYVMMIVHENCDDIVDAFNALFQ